MQLNHLDNMCNIKLTHKLAMIVESPILIQFRIVVCDSFDYFCG